MPDLIYNVKFNIEDNLQEGVADVERYQQEIEGLNAEVAELNAQLRLAGGKTNPIKTLPGQAQNIGKSFSTANQAVFSFSDGIQDSAQFSQGFSQGMRAVGNNIGFTAELFASLERNVDDYNQQNDTSITRMDALKQSIFQVDEQGRAFAGGLKNIRLTATGMVLGINLAITTIMLLNDTIFKSKKEAQEGEAAIKKYAQAIKQLEAIGKPTESIEQGLISQRENLEQALPLISEYNLRVKELDALWLDKLLGTDIAKQLEADIASLNLELSMLGVDTRKISEADAEIEALDGTIGSIDSTTGRADLSLAAFVDNLSTNVERSINSFNLGLNNSEESLIQQRDTLSTLISTYTAAANAGRDDLIPILVELKSAYNDVESAIDSKTEAQLEELRVQDDLRAAIMSADAAFDAYLDEQAENQRERRRQEEEDRKERLRANREFQAEAREAFLNPPSFDDGTIDPAEEKIVERNLELMQRQKDFRVQMVQDFAQAGFDLARSAFGDRKEIAIAEALISTYFAAQKAYESQFLPVPDPSSPARGATAAAAAVVAGLARVAQIKSTDIGSSGGGGAAGSASTPSFGFQSTEVAGGLRFMMPNYTPGSTDGMLTPNVKVDIKADRKQLYAIVKKGEEEYRSIKA